MKFTEKYTKEEIINIIKNSSNRVEVLTKLGVSSNSGPNRIQLEEYIKENKIDISHFQIIKKRTSEDIFIENSYISQAVLRRHYLKGNYSEYKCSICGQEPFWKGKELSLVLDHINGKNTDDRLENLRWICPNCNRQTDTFGAKNKNYFNAKKFFCSSCNKEIKKDNKTGLCFDCYKRESGFKTRDNFLLDRSKHYKDLCPICNKNYKKEASSKCFDCSIKETKQKSLDNLSSKISKDILKDYLRNKTKKQILEDFKIQNSQLKKLCEYYNLSYYQEDILNFSDQEWKKS